MGQPSDENMNGLKLLRDMDFPVPDLFLVISVARRITFRSRRSLFRMGAQVTKKVSFDAFNRISEVSKTPEESILSKGQFSRHGFV